MINSIYRSFIFLLLTGLAVSCANDYAPKPRGYFRIKLPPKQYNIYNGACSFAFEYPKYAKIEIDTAPNAKPCWMDIVFPTFNARLHLSYYKITSETALNALVEDAHTFAFKHTVKATAIDEALISMPDHHMYGILYSIQGNSASSSQFFLTDSSRNYLRGALYFNEKPQTDSIQPVLDFLKEDIYAMIKSARWK
ncbi:gliding motility lipoprotein GldD [Olivibacter domesticus]|uniref:Gliding motility-associated lipoprotein GldD n=1 Tax=Olivibacter domesticus TaxID=407022 RepID=A0A1H7S5R5_OLID1|nr:gliding motility lipoprotein GldD [Olivibacter domesticus]SEL66857.1 gliding motility-associated lipoprotein GldD [Olivibacter domesticus]